MLSIWFFRLQFAVDLYNVSNVLCSRLQITGAFFRDIRSRLVTCVMVILGVDRRTHQREGRFPCTRDNGFSLISILRRHVLRCA